MNTLLPALLYNIIIVNITLICMNERNDNTERVDPIRAIGIYRYEKIENEFHYTFDTKTAFNKETLI